MKESINMVDQADLQYFGELSINAIFEILRNRPFSDFECWK